MNSYIQEELAKGFITPSTSPASAGFFFVKKKDGGLCPCIDYRGLNEITIKYRYPLPLVPSALEQLRSARIFTKLDLCSAYNLIRIRAGDEWRPRSRPPRGTTSTGSLSEHVNHVRLVLQRLIKHQLYAKEEKCEFHRDTISFLGYIISAEGVAMDEKKVNAVLRWPHPSTLKELQRFLGFANFYRRFIRHFSSVAAPLTAMVRKGASRLAWSQPALQAFDDLRQRFTTAPILHHPDPDRPFIVEVDASSTGVGAVLSQRHGEPSKMFPCAYFSHKLSPAERNYDVGNRELLAIKLALEEWQHWLEGAKHPFTFQVSYRPGTQNTKADALSRIHEPGQPVVSSEPVLPTTLILAPVTWDLMTEIAEAQLQDPTPTECPPSLTYVPLCLRPRVLSQVHTVCNITKTPRRLPAGLLQPLPAPQRPWSNLAIDFVTDLPPSNGFTTILSVVDRFSKGCRFIPLPKLPTAMETAEHLCNWVFRLYGLPEDILSDRGPQFTSRLWASFFRLLGVNVSLTSGYHPQANGQVERLNQELTRFLRSYCLGHQEDWSRYLFWAEYAQNSLRKPATNLTPFQCTLGFQPPLFPWSGKPSDLPAVNSWFQRSEETWDRAHVHLQGAIRRYQEQADRRRRPNPGYEPGQWVWLSTRDLRLRLPCKKLSPRYVGPFKIIKQITPVSYRLELPAEYRISPTFHVSLFKPADDPPGVENLEGTASQGPAPIVVDGKEVYRVNTILDSRRRRGELQYLVDWEGFGPEERSWVASGDILDPSLTTDFHTQHPDRPGPRGRGRPRRRVPPRARSRSQGEGSVTTAVSVAPSSRRQRESSPGLLTTFPISPCLGPVLPFPGRSEHFLRRPFMDPFRGRFPAKFWLEFSNNPERFPLLLLTSRCRSDCLFSGELWVELHEVRPLAAVTDTSENNINQALSLEAV
ncbi:Transposon Tf2-9 polyprotein [Labeo rohita]|uniref:Transposon Tf2-9 polyprotein n=1 Tax=Labeo rohita TaxID=84645 RepID=A0ABQ8MWT9_LABRO|nr:Transposon Tf2-9 polyprotein [Labeo rohita]